MRGFAIALLTSLAVSAQPAFQVLMGKATSIAGGQITVDTNQSVSTLLFANQDSRIWRGKASNSLGLIQPGDEVIVKYRRDASGRLVILSLDANIDHITGRIVKVSAGQFEADQNYNADPNSGYRRGVRQIAFDADTNWELSAAEDLKLGRDVDVIGLKTGISQVLASRITVYEGNRPVRMRPEARVIAPDGRVVGSPK